MIFNRCLYWNLTYLKASLVPIIDFQVVHDHQQVFHYIMDLRPWFKELNFFFFMHLFEVALMINRLNAYPVIGRIA
jgi:hypothetical protein